MTFTFHSTSANNSQGNNLTLRTEKTHFRNLHLIHFPLPQYLFPLFPTIFAFLPQSHKVISILLVLPHLSPSPNFYNLLFDYCHQLPIPLQPCLLFHRFSKQQPASAPRSNLLYVPDLDCPILLERHTQLGGLGPLQVDHLPPPLVGSLLSIYNPAKVHCNGTCWKTKRRLLTLGPRACSLFPFLHKIMKAYILTWFKLRKRCTL